MDPEKLNARDKKQLDGLCELRPEVATRLGIGGQDGRLPDASPEGRQAALAYLSAWRDERAPDHEAPEGDREYQLDQRAFSGSVDLLRFGEEELGARDPDVLTELAGLLTQQLVAEPDLTARYTGLRDRLGALPDYLSGAQRSDGAYDPILIARARDAATAAGALCAAIASSAREASDAGALEDALAVDVNGKVEAARAALGEHDKWLSARDPSVGAAVIGTERLDQLLHLRGLDLNSTEVRDLATGMVEQMRLEARRLAKRAYKRTPEEAMALARAQAPLSLDEALSWTSELVDQSRGFLVESEMFPMPARTSLVLSPAPAGVQPVLGEAQLIPQTPYGPERPAHLLMPASASGDLPHYSVADLESLTAFYAYPGLHYLTSWFTEGPSLLRAGAPTGLLGGPAADWALETYLGWAHHCEELMRELMFRDSPAARLVGVEHALKRALLARLDVGVHTGEQTPTRAEALLVEICGLTAEDAARDVRELLRRPGRALSAMLGKLRLQQFRRECKIVWRQAYSEVRFHELLLRGGPMPLTNHFELVQSPPVYQIDGSTVSVNLGADNPYEETADDEPAVQAERPELDDNA